MAYYCNDQPEFPDKVAQILNEIVYLAQHIGNIHDIYQILILRIFNKISKVTNAYKDNEFVRYLTHKFYKLNPEKYLTNKYKLKGPQVSKLLCNTLKAVQKHTNLPMKSIIKANLIKHMKYDPISDSYMIAESKALNFLSTYFDIIHRNKNKPERRYLEFQCIALGGFEYLYLKDWQSKHLVPKETFVMDGKTYDAYTGMTDMVRKGSVEELDEMFG